MSSELNRLEIERRSLERELYRFMLATDADFAAQERRRQAEALVWLGKGLWDGVRAFAGWVATPTPTPVHQTVINMPVVVNMPVTFQSVDEGLRAQVGALVALATANANEKVHDVTAVADGGAGKAGNPACEKVHDVAVETAVKKRNAAIKRQVLQMYAEGKAAGKVDWNPIYELCKPLYAGQSLMAVTRQERTRQMVNSAWRRTSNGREK